MKDLHFRSLAEVSELIRRQAISPVDVTRYLLDRVKQYDGKLFSYVTLTGEEALQRASVAEQEISRGFWRGPLHGVPVAVKDLLFTKDVLTTAGMLLYQGYLPAFNATAVDRLENAGAVLLGKLKTTEGALFTYHPSVVAPRNPWNSEYWSGVSSSGPAVATAAGLCFGALGTDTGGSIRLPSACCGLTGIKPTWGRVSRYGLSTLSNSLDHIGPMARSAIDVATILTVIAGADTHDPTALPVAVPDYVRQMTGSIGGLRIGVDENFANKHSNQEIVAALVRTEEAFSELGAKICRVNIPGSETLFDAYLRICCAEAAFAHRNNYPLYSSAYGTELATLIEQGRKFSAIQLAESIQERQRFAGSVNTLFGEIDLLLTPTLPFPVPRLELIDFESMTIPSALVGNGKATDSVSLYSASLRFTSLFNLSGNPAISFPAGFSSFGLPIGMQLAGRQLEEALLLRAVHEFQQLTDWHKYRPTCES
jgi:amidase